MASAVLKPRPIYTSVVGAPFQPGDFVRVVAAVDKEIHDVSSFIGRFGVVKYLEYDCGCGQSFPDDPMLGIRFFTGEMTEFWPEEVASCSRNV